MSNDKRIDSTNFQFASEQIGGLATRLWTDQQFAWSQLRHSDWNVRYFSFTALVEAWELSKDEIFGLVESLISSSSNPNKNLAVNLLGTLGRVFSGDENDEVSMFVANLVVDQDQAAPLRIEAYFALEEINTAKQSFVSAEELDLAKLDVQYKDMRHKLEAVISENLSSIDWEFVRQFSS